MKNIADFKWSELTLNEGEMKYRILGEQVSDEIFMTDMQEKYILYDREGDVEA